MENVLLVFIPSIESKELKHHCFRLPQGCELTVFFMYAYLIAHVYCVKTHHLFLKLMWLGYKLVLILLTMPESAIDLTMNICQTAFIWLIVEDYSRSHKDHLKVTIPNSA